MVKKWLKNKDLNQQLCRVYELWMKVFICDKKYLYT